MPSYEFSNTVNKIAACDAYLRENINNTFGFSGISSNPLTIITDVELTSE